MQLTGAQALVAALAAENVGHVFGIYRAPRQISVDKKQQVTLPSEKVGRLIVFRVFNKASYALVLDATQPIMIKDRIAQP